MTAPKITEEMIERAQEASRFGSPADAFPLHRNCIVRILTAALTDPEPIPVSNEMIEAGRLIYNSATPFPPIDGTGGYRTDRLADAFVTRVYRAMEAQRRLEATQPQPDRRKGQRRYHDESIDGIGRRWRGLGRRSGDRG